MRTTRNGALVLILLMTWNSAEGWGEPVSHPGADEGVASEIDALRAEIDEYRSTVTDGPIDLERRTEVRSLIVDVLESSRGRTSFTEGPWNKVSSTDGLFTMQADVFIQYDWLLNSTPGENTQYGTDLNTIWLTLSGTVFDPSWSYGIATSIFSDGIPTPEYAYVQYEFEDGLFVQAGILPEAFSLEQAISVTEQLGASLSYAAGQFDAGRPEGLLVGKQLDDHRFWLTFSNGWGQSNINPLENQRMGVMGRFEFKPFGDWDSLYSFNPYPGSTPDGLLLGIGGAYDWGDYDVNGPSAVTGDATRATIDLSWQKSGLGLMATGYYQDVPGGGLVGGRRWAGVGQAAFFLTPTWDVYARGEWGTILDSEQQDVVMATIGTSWFPAGNSQVKVTAEFIQSWGSTVDWLVDGDLGILQVDEPQSIIRTQVQLAF
ncbi:OprO/OprP family phosphate-selective porin [bacterium]|nr:OprO/OprP family phosphate-selective porin [bacterium]